jgi:hypothetical protein
MLAEAKVGVQANGAGTQTIHRSAKDGSLVVSNGRGFYTEAASQGNFMIATNAVAGVAPGTALSTTPPMAIWNPPSSGRNLAILKTNVTFVSGTLGAGSIVYATVLTQTTVPTTGTEIVPQCSLLGFPRGVGRAFTGSTLIIAPAILKPAYTLGAFVGTTAVPATMEVDETGGEIIVTPGTVFVMQGVAAAGTSPLVMFGVCWEEILPTP